MQVDLNGAKSFVINPIFVRLSTSCPCLFINIYNLLL